VVLFPCAGGLEQVDLLAEAAHTIGPASGMLMSGGGRLAPDAELATEAGMSA
jgi:hypothetical protein